MRMYNLIKIIIGDKLLIAFWINAGNVTIINRLHKHKFFLSCKIFLRLMKITWT